jgi:hypothetical protein
MWKLLAPGVGLGDFLTPALIFDVDTKMETIVLFFFSLATAQLSD